MVRMYKKKIEQIIPKESRVGRKRISLDIPTPLHNMLLEGAQQSNCTITMYVIRSLRDRLKMEGIENE